MNKTILDWGAELGVEEQTLTTKFNEYVEASKTAGKSEEDANKYATVMMKRYLLKIKLMPTKKLSGVVLGDNTTDFGAIMKRKYGPLYPEGHFRAGQEIPEHEYTKNILFYDEGMKKLCTITVRHDDVENVVLDAGCKYDIVANQGNVATNFFWDAKISKATKISEVDDMRTYIVNNLQSFIVPTLGGLAGVEKNTPVIVSADGIVNMTLGFNNDYNIAIYDADMGLDDKNIVIRYPAEKTNFSDTAESVIFILQKIKEDGESISCQGFSAFPRKEHIVQIEKMADESTDNTQTETVGAPKNNMFSNIQL